MLKRPVTSVDDPYRLIDSLVAAWCVPAGEFGGGRLEHPDDGFDVAADAFEDPVSARIRVDVAAEPADVGGEFLDSVVQCGKLLLQEMCP